MDGWEILPQKRNWVLEIGTNCKGSVLKLLKKIYIFRNSYINISPKPASFANLLGTIFFHPYY